MSPKLPIARRSHRAGRDFQSRSIRATCVGDGRPRRRPRRNRRPPFALRKPRGASAATAGPATRRRSSQRATRRRSERPSARSRTPGPGGPRRTSALRAGTLRAPTRTTLAEAAEDWLAGRAGRDHQDPLGDPYKPSALRAYEQALRTKVLPELGHLRLSAVTRTALQDLVDRLVADGRGPSTVRNAILPLRAIYRRALTRAEVRSTRRSGWRCPRSAERRERIARPAEAAALIEALPASDRARLGDRPLRRPSPRRAAGASLGRRRLRGGLIRVEQSWDDEAGPIEPKSRAGRRRVPLAKPLRAPPRRPPPAERRPAATASSSADARERRSDHGGLVRRARARLGGSGPRSRSAFTSAATPTPPS